MVSSTCTSLSPGWQGSEGSRSHRVSCPVAVRFPSLMGTISEAHMQGVWHLINRNWRLKRQFSFSYFGMCAPGSKAGCKGEKIIVFLPRWLLLVSDYYQKLLVHVLAENSGSQ